LFAINFQTRGKREIKDSIVKYHGKKEFWMGEEKRKEGGGEKRRGIEMASCPLRTISFFFKKGKG